MPARRKQNPWLTETGWLVPKSQSNCPNRSRTLAAVPSRWKPSRSLATLARRSYGPSRGAASEESSARKREVRWPAAEARSLEPKRYPR
jgi:hypothetical protein